MREATGEGDCEMLSPLLDRPTKHASLQQSWLFSVLNQAERERLVDYVTERQFRKGDPLLERGRPGSNMMILVTGRARVTATSAEGREVTLMILEPGMTLGELALLDGKPRSADVVAMSACLVLLLERRDFLPLLTQNPDLSLRLMGVLCDRLRTTSLALEEVALTDIPTRLASLLLKLSTRYGLDGGQGRRIQLRLSQGDMSSLIAATRESVNKQLRSWRGQGILDEEDGHIIVKQPDVLQALVD
jgi:CRP/FNR family transcriptional regulator, cyclic AMP receptor protein